MRHIEQWRHDHHHYTSSSSSLYIIIVIIIHHHRHHYTSSSSSLYIIMISVFPAFQLGSSPASLDCVIDRDVSSDHSSCGEGRGFCPLSRGVTDRPPGGAWQLVTSLVLIAVEKEAGVIFSDSYLPFRAAKTLSLT